MDTDDIRNIAFQKVKLNNIRATNKNINNIANQIIRKLIEKYNYIIFAGMTATIPNPTYKIFIKIS